VIYEIGALVSVWKSRRDFAE